MCWANDDSSLLTTSADKKIKLFNPYNGELIKTLIGHNEIVTCAIWHP